MRQFSLGVLDDCTIETNGGEGGVCVRVSLCTVKSRWKLSGRRIFKLLPPTLYIATLSKW